MKNIINITTEGEQLVSSTDDGTNTLYINDNEIPSSSWIGSGNYTDTVNGHAITIKKCTDLNGNCQLVKLSDYNYEMRKTALVGQLQMLNYIYPVGSYYETSDANFNPNTAWGGTWERVNMGDKVLFSGDTTGDVTLAETVTNFEYITIFFRDNDGIYDSANLFGNNLAIALSQAHTDYGTTQFYVKTKTFSVRNNRILQQKNGNTVIRNAQVYVRGGAFYQGDYIYITKVVGRNRINGAWHRTA